MDVLNHNCHLVKITLVEVVGAVWVDTFYLLFFLLFLGHCCEDLLETVKDEAVFVV